MFKNIINLFDKNNSTTTQRNSINSILLGVDIDNKINLTLNVNNKTAESAEKFGLLMFLLNEGYYVQSLLELLSDLSKTDIESAKFVEKTINSWSNNLTENSISETNKNIDDPIIKPTHFSNHK